MALSVLERPTVICISAPATHPVISVEFICTFEVDQNRLALPLRVVVDALWAAFGATSSVVLPSPL